MNNLARLSTVKRDLSIPASNTDEDARLLTVIEGVSRAVEDMSGWPLHQFTATRYYRGSAMNDRILNIPDGIVSLTSLAIDTDGDGIYEMPLADSVDYLLGPDANDQKGMPFWEVELLSRGNNLTRWPLTSRCIKAVGVYGWPQTLVAAGVLGTVADTTSTTLITDVAPTLIDAGDTVVVDAEEMYVSTVNALSLTVVRAQNGTTASAHTAGAISRVAYPAPIVEAVMMWGRRNRWDTAGGEQGAADAVNARGAVWAQIRTLIGPYRNWGKA